MVPYHRQNFDPSRRQGSVTYGRGRCKDVAQLNLAGATRKFRAVNSPSPMVSALPASDDRGVDVVYQQVVPVNNHRDAVCALLPSAD